MKITKFFMAMAATTVMFAACDKEENKGNGGNFENVAPVLTDNIADIVVTEETLANEVTFSYSAADFGVATQINYAIEVQIADGPKAVVGTSTTTTATATLEDINYELYVRLGIQTGVATDVNFYVSAQMGASEKLYSEPVVVNVTAIEAGPKKSEWGLVGSMAASNWATNIQMFEGDEYIFALNVTLNEGDKFKFRKDTDWSSGIELVYSGTVMPDAEYEASHGGDATMGKSGVYDVYLLVTKEEKEASEGKFYIMTAGKTPDQAGEAEVVVIDYTNCQLELVGNAVAEQEGAVVDPSNWNWGNVLAAGNGGKPVVSGKVYTWTWSNVQLVVGEGVGFKIRTLSNEVSGEVSAFEVAADKVDVANSVEGISTSDNFVVPAAGAYDITLVIDAETDTKTVTVVAAK